MASKFLAKMKGAGGGGGDAGGGDAGVGKTLDQMGEVGELVGEHGVTMNRRQTVSLALSMGLQPTKNLRVDHLLEQFRKGRIREMLLYITFLALFSVSSLTQRDIEMTHNLVATLSRDLTSASTKSSFDFIDELKSFNTIRNEDDFWDWAVGVVPRLLHNDRWYNGAPYADEEHGFFRKYNLIVGKPHLRQLRVKAEECIVPPRLKKSLPICYPSYSAVTEDKSVFTVEAVEATPTLDKGFTLDFEHESLIQFATFNPPDSAFTYGGSGYFVELTPPSNNNTASTSISPLSLMPLNRRIAALRDLRWTDLQTRAVFLDIALYNSVFDTFVSFRFLVEFLPFGTCSPYLSVRAFRAGFSQFFDYLLLAVDVVVYLFVLYYLFQELRKMRGLQMLYFNDFFNWFNLINLTVFLLVLFFKALYFSVVLPFIYAEEPESTYLDFEYMGWLYRQISNWSAFNSVLCWLKIFTFLKYLNKKISDLTAAVAQAGSDCLLFLAMLLLVFWSYDQAFFLSFGVDVAAFRGLSSGMFALFRSILGDFDFEALRRSNSVLAPLLFISYMGIVFFVMINMFLAIVNKSYQEVLSNSGEDDDPVAVMFRKDLSNRFWSLAGIFGFKKTRSKIDPLKELAERLGKKDPTAAAVGEVEDIKRILSELTQMMKATDVLRPEPDKPSAATARTAGGGTPKVNPFAAARAAAAGGKLAQTVSQAASPARTAAPAASTTEVAVVLPPNWREYRTAEGEKYYYNSKTQETSWSPPFVST